MTILSFFWVRILWFRWIWFEAGKHCRDWDVVGTKLYIYSTPPWWTKSYSHLRRMRVRLCLQPRLQSPIGRWQTMYIDKQVQNINFGNCAGFIFKSCTSFCNALFVFALFGDSKSKQIRITRGPLYTIVNKHFKDCIQPALVNKGLIETASSKFIDLIDFLKVEYPNDLRPLFSKNFKVGLLENQSCKAQLSNFLSLWFSNRLNFLQLVGPYWLCSDQWIDSIRQFKSTNLLTVLRIRIIPNYWLLLK